MVEYALAIALVAGVLLLAHGISTFFGNVSAGVNKITIPNPS